MLPQFKLIPDSEAVNKTITYDVIPYQQSQFSQKTVHQMTLGKKVMLALLSDQMGRFARQQLGEHLDQKYHQ